MEGNEIVFWFSVIVIGCVLLWAVTMVWAYNKVSKND